MSELTGAELDLAVAKVLGLNCMLDCNKRICYQRGSGVIVIDKPYSPSTNWAQGGPLIEEYRIYVGGGGDKDWIAVTVNKHVRHVSSGPTPLIAACRAIVASKEEV